MPRASRFDAVDRQIVALLRVNGRRTNAELARQVGLSEGAIRKKLKKLTAAGILKVVAVADPTRLGYAIDVFSGVQVTPGKTLEVAEHLVSLEAVRYVALAAGSYDILFEAMFRQQDDLLEFLTRTLPAVPGIARVDTWHLLRVLKRNYDWLQVGGAGAPSPPGHTGGGTAWDATG